MVMNITAYKGINTVNYKTTNDTQNVDNKNNINTATEKSPVITQASGTDTFVKSTEEDTTTSTYKPEKRNLLQKKLKH